VNSATFIFPTTCRTTAYVAGINETAIIHVGGWAQFGVEDFFDVAPIVLTNGAPSVVGTQSSISGTANTVANGAMTVRMPLVAGSSYVFAAGFASAGAASVPVTAGGCSGVVTIVRN
jgi:hypothetical protein